MNDTQMAIATRLAQRYPWMATDDYRHPGTAGSLLTLLLLRSPPGGYQGKLVFLGATVTWCAVGWEVSADTWQECVALALLRALEETP